VKKGGFTLIELVVAIVVISIALMSVPLLLSQASKSDEFSINQEAILATATKIGDILTYSWDDNLSNENSTAKILDVSNGDNELKRYPDNNSSRRKGNFKSQYRRKFYATIHNANTLISLKTPKGAIDDFNGEILTLNSGGISDYKIDINLSTSVFYISDKADYNQTILNFGDINITRQVLSTNIKMIEVNATDSTGKLITTLRAFTTNIGEYELIYRTFN
jgi:prepilin-type N-terminal cleavage/methylation domain-containing protein